MRLVLAPVFGAGGIILVLMILTFARVGATVDLSQASGEMLGYGIYVGPHGGFFLVVAHASFLVLRSRFPILTWVPLYAVAGAMAVLPIVFGSLVLPSPKGFGLIGLMGLVFGGLQLVAMRVCLAIEEKIGRRLTSDRFPTDP